MGSREVSEYFVVPIKKYQRFSQIRHTEKEIRTQFEMVQMPGFFVSIVVLGLRIFMQKKVL